MLRMKKETVKNITGKRGREAYSYKEARVGNGPPEMSCLGSHRAVPKSF